MNWHLFNLRAFNRRGVSKLTLTGAIFIVCGTAFGQVASDSTLTPAKPSSAPETSQASSTASQTPDTPVQTDAPGESPGMGWSEPSGSNNATGNESAPLGSPAAALPPTVATDSETSASIRSSDPDVQINGVKQKSRSDLHFVYTAEVAGYYDDNIFINHTNRQSDYYFLLSPGVTFGWGDLHDELRRLGLTGPLSLAQDTDYETRSYLFFHYVPTASIFVDHSDQTTVDHDASVIAQWKMAYLTLTGSSSFVSRSDAEVDLGTRVKRYVYSENIGAKYEYSDRTSLEANFAANLNRYEVGLDSNEFTNQDWFNYQYGARTTLSIGGRFGYLEVKNGAHQYYEQGLVRADYRITDKLVATGDLGVEYRQVQSGKETVDPVFGLGFSFQPFDNTFININAARRIEASASITGDNITATGIDGTFRQRFLRRYYVQFSGSYTNADYHNTGSGVGLARTDNILSVSPSVRMDVTKAIGLEAGYFYRHNDSTVERLTFSENQTFIQVDILF